MSEFTYAEAEVMARRYCESFRDGSRNTPIHLHFDIALGKVMEALEVIERCNGHVIFAPPLNPATGCVYGEEVKRNWLTGWPK